MIKYLLSSLFVAMVAVASGTSSQAKNTTSMDRQRVMTWCRNASIGAKHTAGRISGVVPVFG